MQRIVDGFVTGREPVVSANPVEGRLLYPIDQVLGRARVELVVAGDDIHWCNRVHEVERIDHLFAVPQLAFERRIQEVTAVQDAHVASLSLQFLYQRNHPAETAGVAILYRADAIGIVEVDESKAANLCFGRGIAGGSTNATHSVARNRRILMGKLSRSDSENFA